MAGLQGGAPPATPPRQPTRRSPHTSPADYDEIIERHASANGVDPDLVRAVMGAESSGDPGAVSPKGARGLMQLMPGTAARYGVKDVHDPEENIRGGTEYLKFLNHKFKGDTDLVLAGYNAGEGAVEKYGGVPPFRETRNYVPTVRARYEKLKGRAKPETDLMAGISSASNTPAGNTPSDNSPETDLQAGIVPPGRAAVSGQQSAQPVGTAQAKVQTSGATAERTAPLPPAVALPDTSKLPAVQQAMTGEPVSGDRYETPLNDAEEAAYRQWKQKYAPNDSGADYDLRGAYKAGLTPDPKSGHWPDTFKKPNHPTFSNESQYASGDDAAKAGHWQGEQFVPPEAQSEPGRTDEFAPAGPGYAAEQQKQNAFSDISDQASRINASGRAAAQRQTSQAGARRQQMVGQLRDVWLKSAQETAKNADPELGQKLVDQAKNASAADVIKWARSNGMPVAPKSDSEQVARAMGRERRGGFSLRPSTAGEMVTQGQSDQTDQSESALIQAARHLVVSRQGGEENIARIKSDYQQVGRDPSTIDKKIDDQVAAEVARHKASQLSAKDQRDVYTSAASILNLPGFLQGVNTGLDKSAMTIPAMAAGMTRIIGDLTNSDSIRDLAAEYQKEVNKRTLAQQYAKKQLGSVNDKVEWGARLVGDVLQIGGLSAVLGPTKAMAAMGSLATLGQTGNYREALKEGVKGGVYGEFFKMLPYLERYPAAQSAAQKLVNFGTDVAAVGAGSYALERASGKSHDEALHAALTNSIVAGVLRLTEIVPDLKLAERTIASESTPEWFREVVGKATGKKPAIVVNETGDRAASVYVDPKTNAQVVREIDPNDPLVTSGRPTKTVNDREFENVIPNAEAQSAKAASSEVAPMNRQLTEKGGEKAPTRAAEPKPTEPKAPEKPLSKPVKVESEGVLKAEEGGIDQGFKHMAGAISDNLYRGMFDRLEQGKLPAPFPKDKQPAFEQMAKTEYDAGRVKKWEDLRDLANPPSKLATAQEIWDAKKPVRLLNTDAHLSTWQTIDGVSYELYRTPDVGIIRVFDNESRNIVELLKFPTLKAAEAEMRKATEAARAAAPKGAINAGTGNIQRAGGPTNPAHQGQRTGAGVVGGGSGAPSLRPGAKPAAGAPAQEEKPVSRGGQAVSQNVSEPLPQHLAGAKPRYSYGAKQFDLEFTSKFDKAAYITAQETPSKEDAAYVQWARDNSGLSEAQVRAHGRTVKATIKGLAKDASPGVLRVPSHDRARPENAEERALVEKEVRAGRTIKNEAKMREKYPDVFDEVDAIQKENRRQSNLMQNRAVYRVTQEMLATGKWPNGKRLTEDERKTEAGKAQQLRDWLIENDPHLGFTKVKESTPAAPESNDLGDIFDKHLAGRREAAAATEERKTQSTITKVKERDAKVLRKQLAEIDKELKHLNGSGADFAYDMAQNDKTALPRHQAKIDAANEQRKEIVAALKKAEPGAEAKPAQKQWRRIGSNADGDAVFEDENGVRALESNGIRTTEPVALTPTRGGGVQMSYAHKGKFLLDNERTSEAKPNALGAPEEMTTSELVREGMHESNRRRVMEDKGGEGLPETVSGKPDPYAAEYNRRRLQGGQQKTPAPTDRKSIAKGLADLYGPMAARGSIFGTGDFKFDRNPPKAEFEIKSDNRIELQNEAARNLLSLAYQGQYAGVFESNPAKILKGLEEAKRKRISKTMRADIDRFAEAVKQASQKTGAVRIYAPSNVRHEGFHEASYEASGQQKNAGVRHSQENLDKLTSGPTWKKLESFLAFKNYQTWMMKAPGSERQAQGVFVDEAAAFIAENYDVVTGDLVNDPLTAKEAVDWMDLWFQSFAETNGRVSLEKFTELINEAEQARQQVYDRLANESGGAAQPEVTQALGGMAEGRQSVAASIHGPPGKASEVGTMAERALHASPHTFDKFSSKNIGTGEGAQSYGHGLYFTDTEEVANYYKEAFVERLWYDRVRPLLDVNNVLDVAEEDMREFGVDPEKTSAQEIASSLQVTLDNAAEHGFEYFESEQLRKAIELLEEKPTRLYEVELAPKPDEYLLWDKPLKDQGKSVQAALDKMETMEGLPKGFGDAVKRHRDSKTFEGNDLYRELINVATHNQLPGMTVPPGDPFAKEGVSQFLHSLGVRGTKYLDQNSRGAAIWEAKWSADGKKAEVFRRSEPSHPVKTFDTFAEADAWIAQMSPKPTYNYVIFSDDDVSITSMAERTGEDARYQQAKPLFEAGLAPYRDQGLTPQQAVVKLIDELLDTHGLTPEIVSSMKPDIMRFLGESVPAHIDDAAHEAATSPQNELPEPTQGQKEAGNYQKGHVRVAGMDFSIENPAGSTRSGVDPNGKKWEIELKSHYGYIKKTEGADGEHIDAYLRPGLAPDYAGSIYVVNQTKGNGHFDEHKAMIGWATEAEAKAAYLENYEKGWDNIRSIAAFPDPQAFKDWLRDEDNTVPAESPTDTITIDYIAALREMGINSPDELRPRLFDATLFVFDKLKEHLDFEPDIDEQDQVAEELRSLLHKPEAFTLSLKGESNLPQLKERNYGSINNPDVPALGQAFAGAFAEGREFKSIIEARQFAAELLGGKVEPGTQAAKKVDEAVELGAVMHAREIVRRKPESPTGDTRGRETGIYRDLVDFYEKQQPNLGVKTSTSVANQAYSTPVPLAYVASRLAGVTHETSVEEPTAGNGALLIEADPEHVWANEKDESRAASLRTQGFHVSQGDASTFIAGFHDGQFDVVIANPPFGPVKENGESKRFAINDRYTTSEIDHAIAFKALEAMTDDGSAVLILGGINATDEKTRSNGYATKAKLEFYVTLYGEYNVVDHFTVNGDLYKKQGAGWPVDVVVIHGRGKSKRTLPAADVPRIYNSWDELEGVLDEPYRKLLDARRVEQRAQPQPARAPDRGRGEGQVSSGAGPRDLSGTVGGATQRTAATGAGPGTGALPVDRRTGREPTGLSDTGLTEQPGGRQEPVSGGAAGTERTGPVSDEAGNTGRTAGAHAAERGGSAAGLRSEQSGELANEPHEPARQPRPVEKADVTQMQGPYRPASKMPSLDTKVPLNMKAAIEAALDHLVDKVGDLDNFVAKELEYDPQTLELYFSAEQVDAIAMAIDNIKSGSGFIIGDQGGIGKGRVVAAIIRWALRHDKVPIFVTEKPNLYKDIVRDLTDIGEGVIPDWMERAIMTNMDETVPLDDEDDSIILTSKRSTHAGKLQQMINEGSIKPHEVIFTTYNGMQTISGGKRTIRQDFLQEFARDAVLLFDESHNAGGAEKKDDKKDKKGGPPLDRALFARQIIELAYGVFYSSATYAKRPQTMDLYSKTDMRKAFSSLADMVAAVEKGGVPMQQAMAAMLAERGQYIRRERDFEGMSYETKELEVDKVQAEQTSAVMRSIFDFDRARLAAIDEMDKAAKAEAKKIVGSDGATGKAGVEGSNFTSLMHNLVNQMLLMLKTDKAVDEAIAVLKREEKPVITLSNTMGSFIENYAKDNGLKPGDMVGLTFGDMLKRYLERSREVRIGKAFGPTTKHYLSDAELGPAGMEAYNKTLAMITDTDWSGMPVSPIDYMKHRLKEQGYNAGEITGRQHILDYQTRKATVAEKEDSRERGKAEQMFFDTYYRTRPPKEVKIAGRSRTLTEFNNGTLDALIINQAGSTGLSIHASSKFRDQRKRVMLILQPELNIDTHMQMMYRVDRTGQVVKPGYMQLGADVPAEKRPMAILSKKMASLNANTTAAKGSAYEGKDVPDFMNEYGDEVVASLMEDDPDLHKLIGKPLKDAQGHSGLSRKDAIRKVTGRIPLLPIAEQQRVYDLIESEYKDLIARLDAMGENSLEAKSLDLDAKLLKKTEIFKGKGDSPFERGAWAEESDVKRVGKPYKSEQVLQLLQEVVGTVSGSGDLLRAAQDKSRQLASAREVEQLGKFEDYRREIVDAIADPARATAQRVKLQGHWQDWQKRNRELYVGATIKMDTPLGELYGIVTKIEQKGKPKMPVALGSWRVTVAIADAVRSVTIPFSKLDPLLDVKGSLLSSHYSYTPESYARIMDRERHERVTVPVLEAFDRKQTEAREHRTILTGNIPAAFGRFKRGRIMNFTDEEGQLRHGVMMPADFNLEKAMTAEAIKFTFAEDIIKFLAGGSRLVATPDSVLRLNWSHGVLRLATSKSKSVGGQYFASGNPVADAIMDAAGDEFASSGNTMQMLVDGDRAEAVINALLQKGVPLETSSYKEEAQRIINANPRKGQAGHWNPMGAAAPTGYETSGPSRLRGLLNRIRTAAGVLRGTSGEPKAKYSILGSLQDIWTENLSQLEKANLPTFAAALRAAGARTTGKMLMRVAAQRIQALLRTKNAWDLTRAALTEGRLRGVRDRWFELRDLSRYTDDEELQEFYSGGGEENQPGIRHLVAMLEGMPFGKEFKQNEGLTSEDSVVGIVDSLFATEDYNAARAYLGNLFQTAGDSVASVMDPDDFESFTSSRIWPEVLKVYKEQLEQPMNDAHALNEGIFSDALGPLDTYYPLTALDENGELAHRTRMKVFRGTEYRVPENMRNKMATGLSPLYDTSPEALGAAMSQAERRNTVASLLKTAEAEGLIRTLKRNEQNPPTIEFEGEEYKAKTVQKGKDRILFINGKTVHVSAPRMAVPEWLYKELQPILEEGDYSQGRIAGFIGKLNLFGMAGPIDAAAHTANVVGALVVGTPYIGTDILSKTIGNTPVTKLLTAWVNIITTDPWSDDAAEDIIAMSKLGVIPSRYATVVSGWLHKGRQFAGQTGAQKKYLSLAPLLYGPGGIDIRARLLMYRLARTAVPNASPAELRHFINQMGNYNFETMGSVERFLKQYGIAPFYTAGSTMWRTGIKATFGMTPLPTKGESRGKRGVLRVAQLLSGGIVGIVGLWLLMYKAYTGKWPWEDERARLLQIPLNEKHRHHWLADKVYGKGDSTAYVGIGFFSPLIERGLRSTGLIAAFNAKMSGATKGQAAEEASREIINSAIHPFISGPVTQAGIVGVTGKHPYITSMRDLTGKESWSLLPAMKTQEPGLANWRAHGIAGIANLNSFYSNIARNIGLVQEAFDLDPGYSPKDAANQPNPWLRMAVDLVAPRLVKGPVNLGKQRKKFRREEKATESTIRREEGLPKRQQPRKHSGAPGVPGAHGVPEGP